MTNNDVLRRLRYIFDLNDNKMMALFSLGGTPVSRAQMSDWLKKDEDEAFALCSDVDLATFLNGFIIDKRGKREGPPMVAETELTNNAILAKLKIALELRAEDMLDLLQTAGMTLSKPELSAFFRKPGHKHYRQAKDQVLRNVLKGLQQKYRPRPAGSSDDDTTAP